MVIFGTKMCSKENSVTGWGFCENCGVYGRNTSYNGRQWVHVYFIPIVPNQPRVRVIKECKKCSKRIHLPEKNVPEILVGMYNDTKKALAAIIKGEKEFDDDGEMIPAVSCLAGSVEMLYCLNAADHVELILDVLQEKDQTYAYRLVKGEELEFQGKLDEAADAYTQAIRCNPEDARGLISLGVIFMKKEDLQSARKLYEKAGKKPVQKNI